MESIHDVYPEYGTTSRLDHLRATEYSYLDEQGHLYLDFTGAGLAAKSQFRAHEARLQGTLFGNPHSTNPTSQSATTLVEEARARVLDYLNASPKEYTAIFTPNATGAARLVAEAYPFRRGARLVLTADNHNSVNGFREFARRNHARTVYVPVRAPDLRVDPSDLASALQQGRKKGLFRHFGADAARRSGLFAYPAQSNFSGVRHPLAWVDVAQEQGYDVLLDAAAYLPTARLDLSATGVRPEFVTVSWYKLFGYPTGVGCLVVRRDALARLASSRPWFSGGTITAAAVGIPWHAMAPEEAGFEDGTANFLSIPDVHYGLDWLDEVGMPLVNTRVRSLTGWCLGRLLDLDHSDGSPMVRIYGPTDMESRGGTICFNFLDPAGKVVDERLVAKESAAEKISLRTGCFCNPGAGESAFGLDKTALRSLSKLQNRSLDTYLRLVAPVGAVRISFGFMSTEADVERFISFAERTYRDRLTETLAITEHHHGV
ncbi:Molybdenum cofactor sulfurase [Colletotrichum orbiculare MAFF 240422]|uniref:Molybdenum cofactor sulfurase n=1 Tax=Colletotrichum orbiculare (strain 104-T / ATCC 96160 / CBS 514.97 / LARS 414 / MAFF 240422) TaxID=1213857 RepID=A0A484FB17_COLOR|nr:Molybdenum cofactor sulfurase [Colletotrichum orbiculare MAFF 240422]